MLPPTSAPKRADPGDQLGGYRLVALLGAGGTGEVFLAEKEGPEKFLKQVALKCLHPHRARDLDVVNAFLDEARLTARMSHPNVAQVLELGEDSGRYYITMELVQGCSLRALMEALDAEGRVFPERVAGWVMEKALRGLHHAHQLARADGALLGLVHRDVSPENIMVGPHGTVKVTDFGLAKAFRAEERKESGVVRGKVDYMPPEQRAGHVLDATADVYAVGAVLSELLGAPTAEDSSLRRNLRALAEEAQVDSPQKRPPSALRMADALEALLGSEALGVPAVLDELLRELGESRKLRAVRTRTGPVVNTLALEPVAPVLSRRRRWFGVALLAFVAAAVGMGAWVASHHRPPPPPVKVEAPPASAPPARVTETQVDVPTPPAVSPSPRAPTSTPARHAAVVRQGEVMVRVNPWAEVFVDGLSVGTTPMAPLRLNAGRHTFRFVNPELRSERTMTTVVRAGARTVLKSNLLVAQ